MGFWTDQPAISATKLEGLVDRYGWAEGAGTAYFSLHAELAVEHAAAERALIEPRLEGADVDALLDEAERVLAANWALLDGGGPGQRTLGGRARAPGKVAGTVVRPG